MWKKSLALLPIQIAAGYAPSVVIIDPQEWRRLATTKPNDLFQSLVL
jgi:hypothetical protein